MVPLATIAALAITSSAAEARSVCGPNRAKTLAKNEQARVYVSDGSVRSCHAKRPRAYRLGARAKVIDVRIAGRYASVRGRTSDGQSLRVFDLRRARPESRLQRYHRIPRTKLDASGLAVLFAVSFGGQGHVTSSDGAVLARVDAVDDVGLRGWVVAYRIGDQVVLQDYYETFFESVRKATNGELLRVGNVSLSARGATVTARRGTGARVALGTPGVSACDSRSTCSGWGRVRVVGDRLIRATLDVGINSWVDVIDLAARTTTRLCPGNVQNFVVSQTGKVACAQDTPPLQILVEGVVVDSGPGIFPGSLHQRGDQFVWLNGGVERTAPIPTT